LTNIKHCKKAEYVITLKSHGKSIGLMDESVTLTILNIYPDEHLSDRPLFKKALGEGEIAFSALRDECDRLLLPWQLFLLNSVRAEKEITSIRNSRTAKFEKKMIASRTNEGAGVSLRIADRLISLQEYAREGVSQPNSFVGKLKNLHRDSWAATIVKHFGIDPAKLKDTKKDKVLGYLIKTVEQHDIRVARGVLTNKLLPALKTSRSSYRKSSGFVVKDDKVPYIFIPNEINDSESPGRQILTLLSLLTLIGLDRYDSYITGEFEIVSSTQKIFQQIYGVVSEILLPYEATNPYKGKKITEAVRDTLATKYMLTPSAVVVTLRQRGYIESDATYQQLLEGTYAGGVGPSTPKRTPRIDTAVNKMCGRTTSQQILEGVRNGSLSATRAQYLIFGRVDKLSFEKYKANVGL
jgi:hypothetical protein